MMNLMKFRYEIYERMHYNPNLAFNFIVLELEPGRKSGCAKWMDRRVGSSA